MTRSWTSSVTATTTWRPGASLTSRSPHRSGPAADGKRRAGALTHADPALATQLAAMREHPVPTAGPLISQRAYTTGTTQLARDLAAELPSWAAVAPDMIEIVASVHPHSALAAPL